MVVVPQALTSSTVRMTPSNRACRKALLLWLETMNRDLARIRGGLCPADYCEKRARPRWFPVHPPIDAGNGRDQ
jgi:hypothetical protein